MAGKISELKRKTRDSAKYIPTRNGSGDPAGRLPGQVERTNGNETQKRSI